MDHVQNKAKEPIMSKIDKISSSKSDFVTEGPIIEDYESDGQVGFYRKTGKRLLDVTLVFVALPLVVPLVVVLAIFVMLDGSNPFFGHVRIGRNGMPFKCWKLRSMVANSEAFFQAFLLENPSAKHEWEANFKLSNDPRITRIGGVLRKYSLDELPQLWNILKGEMSIVGPRPVTREELKMYGRYLPFYQALPPGLTGLWQVSGRNDVKYVDRVHLDFIYWKSHSMTLDLRIIVGTFKAVFDRTGK